MIEHTFLDTSWQQRRELAVFTYSNAMKHGCRKMEAALYASYAAQTDERTVRKYVKQYYENEGFFHPVNWGKNQKTPIFLDDEEVKLGSGCEPILASKM